MLFKHKLYIYIYITTIKLLSQNFMVSYGPQKTSQHQPHVLFSTILSYLKSHSLLPPYLIGH